MSEQRKQLSEMLSDSPYLDVLGGWEFWERAADHLIANGVTVQRWIPVTERLPTAEDAVDNHVYAFLKDTKSGGEWPYEVVRNHPDWFTHWVPLPEPPGEVADV